LDYLPLTVYGSCLLLSHLRLLFFSLLLLLLLLFWFFVWYV
jgi:hypothetical protein